MTRPVPTGRRGTRVFPAGWAAVHRPTVEDTQTVIMAWRRPGSTDGAFDPVTGTKPVTPHPPYASQVTGRLQVLTGATEQMLVDDQVVTASYQISVPVTSVDFRPGDLGLIISVGEDDDPTLVDRTLQLVGVERAAPAWERDLLCIDQLD